jgi:hypothetical protein
MRLQVFLGEGEIATIGIDEFLAHGQALVSRCLVHEPDQANRRHEHNQRQ